MPVREADDVNHPKLADVVKGVKDTKVYIYSGFYKFYFNNRCEIY